MTTWRHNPAKVELLAATHNPLEVLYQVWCRAKGISQERGQYMRRQACVALFKRLIYDYTQIPEMVQFTWWLEGVPRAFFDQAVRHRKTSIFARSQRVTPQRRFAYEGEYLTTREVNATAERHAVYLQAMQYAQTAYNTLLNLGVPVEDARGVLPLHLRTGFAWATSLRDLADIFRTRTCHLLQQEYWAPIAVGMRERLVGVDPALDLIFQPPCLRDTENRACVSTFDARLRLEAVQSGRADLHPCRIWAKYFATPSEGKELEHAVGMGRTRWAVSPEEVVLGYPRVPVREDSLQECPAGELNATESSTDGLAEPPAPSEAPEAPEAPEEPEAPSQAEWS